MRRIGDLGAYAVCEVIAARGRWEGEREGEA